jgi:HD domain
MPSIRSPQVRNIACRPVRHRAAHLRSAGQADQDVPQEKTSSDVRADAPAARDSRRSSSAVRKRSPPSTGHLVPRYLIPVATATVSVAVCPVLIVWWLRASGAVGSPVLGMLFGMALSLGASWLGCALWERRVGSEDVLFSELLIWGFLRRLRSERRLASARELLGPMSQAQRRVTDGLSPERQAKLLEQLAAGMDTRDPNTHGHSRRVARHSWMIAKRMGLPREQVARIRTAAAVHDVGKIETPLAILRKPGHLTDAEYDVIKNHPADGARMAAVLHDPELASMILYHHERLDGSGYPSGLSGEEIPLGARIIAVADTFDAMTSERPYRPAYPHKKAIDILRGDAGTRLDPAVVRVFFGYYSGRRSVALWASVTTLPERALAWLGGGVAGGAAAAKVMVVSALVGGAAATTSMLPLPAGKSHPSQARAASPAGPRAQTVHPPPVRASVRVSPPKQRSRPVGRGRPGVLRPYVHSSPPTSQRAISSSGEAVGAQPPRSEGSGGGSGEGTGPGKGESPRENKAEEPHGKIEGPHGENKTEEPHGKVEEPHGEHKAEEPHGKVEEPHGENKAEEPHGEHEAAGKSASASAGNSAGRT